MQTEAEKQKRWFIVEDKEGDIPNNSRGKHHIRYIAYEIRSDNEYDATLCVTMANNYNSVDVKNAKLEWVDNGDRFATKHEAQIEILVRERFNG